MTTIIDLDDFKALDPFFRIIEPGLDGLADGGHYFDLLAEDSAPPTDRSTEQRHRDRVLYYCPDSTRSTLVTFAGSIGTPASGSESVGAQYISGASISTAYSISWMSDSRAVSASSARYPGNSIRTGGSPSP